MSVNDVASELVSLGTGRPFDQARAEAAVRELLIAVGEDPERQACSIRRPGCALVQGDLRGSVLRTRRRVEHNFRRGSPGVGARARHSDVLDVRAPPGVLPRCCSRWLHPGKVGQGHRFVEARARRRPVRQASAGSRTPDQSDRGCFDAQARPRGAIVVIEAEHLCMAMRGIRKPGASTTTSAVRGLLQSSAASRSEALDLILRK